VDQEVKEMPTGKYHESDGIMTYFFHHCWHIVREEVWQLIEYSRISRGVLPMLNVTHLTLVPKEEQVTHPK